MNIIAIIPARGGSKGIPKKNIIDFCGKPLIAWSIKSAHESKYITGVYVSTDDSEIAEVAEKYGACVIKRPKKFATDTSQSEEAILHAITEIEKKSKIDAVVFLQGTSPVREQCDIDEAIKLFFQKKYDSLFSSLVLDDFCAWWLDNNKLKSLTFDYKNRGLRQTRRPYFLENGSIYIFKPEILKKEHNRFGGKIGMYYMPFWKSYEIDKPEDIEICKYFMENKILKNSVIKINE